MTLAVIGGGLAGSLLALELRQRGLPVVLVDGSHGSAGVTEGATELSYGAVAAWAAPPTPLGRLMRQAPGRWGELQQRYGAIGWRRRCWLRLHGEGAMRWLPGVPLPCGQVEAMGFAAALPDVLARAGVQRRQARVVRLEPVQPNGGGRWRLELTGGESLEAGAVVLAAGAHSRDLWPALSPALWVSWAGVIQLEQWPAGYRRGQLVLPGRFERLALERRAPVLEREQWVVDAGLVPWGGAALVGQISLVRPSPRVGEPPDPARMEQRLREGLERFDSALAQLPGTYRQAPVAFCTDGQPLVGRVPDAPGLWQFTGFSAAFAQVPVLAPGLADAIRELTAPLLDRCG